MVVTLDILTVVMGLACLLLAAQLVWLWRLSRLARALGRYDERLSQLSDAMGLLAEASESGFRALAAEIERQGDPARPRPVRPVNVSRLSAAARRGRTHAEIAAAEGVSESEVALRLHLAAQAREGARTARRRAAALQEAVDGAVQPD